MDTNNTDIKDMIIYGIIDVLNNPNKDDEVNLAKFAGWAVVAQNMLEKQLADANKHEKEIETTYFEPYFGWCDVDGCENEACGGGYAWYETGYWKVCYKHSAQYREGKKQPKMKQFAIVRETSRDPATGYLPPTKTNIMQQEQKLIKAILKPQPRDGLLKLLADKDKKLSEFFDLQDPFRRGFILAEEIVKKWAEDNYPLK